MNKQWKAIAERNDFRLLGDQYIEAYSTVKFPKTIPEGEEISLKLEQVTLKRKAFASTSTSMVRVYMKKSGVEIAKLPQHLVLEFTNILSTPTIQIFGNVVMAPEKPRMLDNILLRIRYFVTSNLFQSLSANTQSMVTLDYDESCSDLQKKRAYEYVLDTLSLKPVRGSSVTQAAREARKRLRLKKDSSQDGQVIPSSQSPIVEESILVQKDIDIFYSRDQDGNKQIETMQPPVCFAYKLHMYQQQGKNVDCAASTQCS
jgi:hypothetical protein